MHTPSSTPSTPTSVQNVAGGGVASDAANATDAYARQGHSRRKPGDPRSDVAVDRDRLVHSHAFRRLQRKMQIVGIARTDFFRTRLTHTIECAQLGRAIAGRLSDDAWAGVVHAREDFSDVIEAACLAHDLGHPPFGHTGEEALDAALSERCGLRFEGNAQSFRIVTLLEPKKYNRTSLPVKRPLGLDLTRVTLQAMTKYPWTEHDPRTAAANGKFGVYETPDDLEYFDWLWDGNRASAHRTVPGEVLEAADDLAYAVHDVEDGIWARFIPIDQIAQLEPWAIERITAMVRRHSMHLFATDAQIEDEVRAVFAPLVDQPWARGPFDRSREAEGGLKSFCSQLTNELLSEVTAGARLRWSDNPQLQRRIAMLKGVVWAWMIEQPELVTRRHGQRRIVFDLVDGFLSEPGMLPYPEEWERARSFGEAAQVRLVADHIASMTDDQARLVHAEMTGRSRTDVPLGE